MQHKYKLIFKFVSFAVNPARCGVPVFLLIRHTGQSVYTFINSVERICFFCNYSAFNCTCGFAGLRHRSCSGVRSQLLLQGSYLGFQSRNLFRLCEYGPQRDRRFDLNSFKRRRFLFVFFKFDNQTVKVCHTIVEISFMALSLSLDSSIILFSSARWCGLASNSLSNRTQSNKQTNTHTHSRTHS